jgi:hypothetical protein
MMKAYTNIVPLPVFWGIIWGVLAIGMWRRNRSVRLVMITFAFLGLVIFSTAGMGLGIMEAEKQLGMIFMSLGIAGSVGMTLLKR